MDAIILLTTLKEMGFEAGQIISTIVIYILLSRKVTALVDEKFTQLIAAIKDLEKSHNERIQKIESHVGIK